MTERAIRAGVIVFPGSNCDRDCLHACGRVLGWRVEPVWHRDAALPSGLDLVILPGGFSHGDYLRAGALAALSPIMRDVARHVREEGHALGICNGFQIMCEAGILPGALRMNRCGRFRCEDAWLRVERTDTPFTRRCPSPMRLPIAHREGCYRADRETLKRLEGEGRVLFRYCDAQGETTDAANPNGSTANIAGVASERLNAAGLMPHPERACERLLGSADGRAVFESFAEYFFSLAETSR